MHQIPPALITFKLDQKLINLFCFLCVDLRRRGLSGIYGCCICFPKQAQNIYTGEKKTSKLVALNASVRTKINIRGCHNLNYSKKLPRCQHLKWTEVVSVMSERNDCH